MSSMWSTESLIAHPTCMLYLLEYLPIFYASALQQETQMSLIKELSEVFELCKRGIRTDGSITPELKVKLPDIFAILTVRLYGITCNDHELKEDLVVLLPSLLPHAQYCRNFKRFCLSMHQLLLKDGSVQPCYLQLVQQCNYYANPLIIQLLATLEHMDGKIYTLADSLRLASCLRQWMAMVAPTGVVPSDKIIHDSIHTALDLAYNAEPMHSASLQPIHRSVAHILACLLDMGSCNVGVAARDFVEKLLCTSIHQIASGGTDGSLESSPLLMCVGLALAVSATGTANPLTESFRPHDRNPRGESPSAHIRYRRVHGLLRDAFRCAVRTYIVLGTPPVALSGSGAHPAVADEASTALVPRQRKAILRSLIDWMFIVGRRMPGADTITIDILCEELLFPADAGFVPGFGSQAAVLAVPFRLVAIDATAQALRRVSGGPGPQCCDRLVGMFCDVAMLDRSAAVRGRALEVLLQVHFPAKQGLAPPAGTMNYSANSRGFAMNSGVLKVLLLKCGDISLPVARVAIAGLLHQLTAEGVLAVLRVAHCSSSSSTDPVPVAAIIGLLESIRFLVQLYCHRFSTLVVSTAAAAAAEGAGLAPGAIHGLMSDCRTEQESLYELCQSLSECHLLTACCYPCLSVRLSVSSSHASSGSVVATYFAAEIMAETARETSGSGDGGDDTSASKRALSRLVDALPLEAFRQQGNDACVALLGTMVWEVVMGGALHLHLQGGGGDGGESSGEMSEILNDCSMSAGDDGDSEGQATASAAW